MGKIIYKTGHKQLISQPLLELSNISPPHIKLAQQAGRWHYIQFDKHPGLAIYHPHLINDLFSEQDVKITPDPWEDPAKLGEKALNLRPCTQRTRRLTPELEAIQSHLPSEFFDRWLPWTESALKKTYIEDRDGQEYAGIQAKPKLYENLRRASMMVVGRTVCSMFKGELLKEIETALEGLDTSYARVIYTGARVRFGFMQSPDVKHAAQCLKQLEKTIRPIIRDQIGGGEKRDDLLTRWVHTKDINGRTLNLKEDQVINEVVCFLVMAYTSLPKILFGAVTSIDIVNQSDFLEEIAKETSNAVKLITNLPTLGEGTPPPITPHNEMAFRTIPLHNAIVLEALRLYPAAWLSQYRVTEGVMPLGGAQADEESGPTVSEGDLVWLSPWGAHHHSEYFTQPMRFWPQRWAGNLEKQLPTHQFAPFGYHGKPSLSEVYCRELAPRFLMMWFARYTVVDVPKDISWELSICLRPKTSVGWLHKRDYYRFRYG